MNGTARIRATGAASIRATGADLLMSGTRFVLVCGPLGPWRADQARAALGRLAAAGRQTRLGLRPDAGTVRWHTDPVLAPGSVCEVPPAESVADTAALLQRLRREPADLPFRLILAGRQVILDVDHMLGDGQYYLNMVAALERLIRTGELPAWATTPPTPHPLPRALWHWFGRHPSRLRALPVARSALKGTAAPNAAAPVSAQRPWTPSVAVVITRQSAALADAVRRWRTEHAPGASSAMLAAVMIRRALTEAGIPVADPASIAVDCRRYAPPGSVISGNFVLGLTAALPPSADPVERSAALRAACAAGYPLAWLGFGAGMIRLRRRRPAPPDTVSVTPRAQMIYTDLGHAPQFATAHWAPGEQMLAGLLDPAGPEAVSVLGSGVGAERSYSISFHDNVFDRAAVERAVAVIGTDPVGLLDAGSVHQ
ncbi:hypothetical protein [Skermania piniformis]|uniref:Condensation domain-containing protein n=1 Tax=Skermania pinensis TaxID=39122 RepID=A0ABX8SBI7_9ACTN|nr:hypothetical protein [Skermania piniformis]QXQ15224.1 hypothetical protein KV203_07830 [Skermania piniformis]